MRRALFLVLGLLLLPLTVSAQVVFLHKSLADWRSDLDSLKPSARRSAAFALGRLGSVSIHSVEDLGKLVVSDTDPGVREMAATAIGDIILNVTAFVPKHEWEKVGAGLQKALKSDDSVAVRRSAAYALGAFGSEASSAVESLKKALSDTHPAVRQNAAWALGRVSSDGKIIGNLCDRLGDDNPLVRRDASAALGALASKLGREKTASAAAPLLNLVKREKDDVVLKTALGTLVTLVGESHRDQAGTLYPYLDSKDPEVARSVAFVLGNMGGDPAKRAMRVLRTSLADPDPQVQGLTAVCMANAGGAAMEAYPDLAKLLSKSANLSVRRNCAIALGQIAENAIKTEGEGRKLEETISLAIPALDKALKPSGAATTRMEDELREYAAEALSRIGFPYNKGAMATIRDVLRKDRNQLVRQRCVWALFTCPGLDLEALELKDTLKDILEESSTESLMVRYDAARLLAWAFRDRTPERTLDVLLHMMNNRGLRVFSGSETEIQGVPDERRTGTSTIRARSGGDARYMAAMAMGWLGVKGLKDKRIMSALDKAAKDTEPKLKEEANKALDRLRGSSKE